jgi:hypothetical protein
MSDPVRRIESGANLWRPYLTSVASLAFLLAAGSASAQGQSEGHDARLDEVARLYGVREKEVARIEKLGGTIAIDSEVPGRPVIGVDFSGSRVTDPDLAALKEFPKLARLDLSKTKITDTGLKHLVGLEGLQKLSIADTSITEAGIDALLSARQGSLMVSRRSGTLKYFAEEAFGQGWAGDFLADWYSEDLFAMKEPSLTTLRDEKPGAVAYRFLWTPSFHPALTVRIVPSASGATLFAVQLEKAGYGGGKPSVSKSIRLNREQWQDFERRVNDARFWSLPTDCEKRGMADGAAFVMEGVRGGEYHVVHANSQPDADPDFRRYKALCEFMVRLSGLDVMETWKRY